MHPDKKVGLALGILLIGIVGALFFRNEAPSPDENGPALANPQALDSRIRHKPNAPYLADGTKTTAKTPTIPDALVPEVAPHIPGATAASSNRLTATVPEPIRPNARRDSDATVSVPTPAPGNGGLNDGVPAPREKGERTVAASSEAKTHEVAAGESLSSIAFKYLGTHKRYMEIYEANKDVLRSPNDLSVGMKLKIPTKERSAAATSATTSASASTEPPSVSTVSSSNAGVTSSASVGQSVPSPTSKSDEPASSKPLFVRPRSTQKTPTSKTGRPLTQATPPDVPSIEGLDLKRDPAVIASKPEDELVPLPREPMTKTN